MARYVTLSVSMPPEMADGLDDEANKHGMKTAEYVRQVLSEHEATPFECEETVLCKDENHRSEDRKTGAA